MTRAAAFAALLGVLPACAGPEQRSAEPPPPARNVGRVDLRLPDSWRSGVRRDHLTRDEAGRRFPGAIEATIYAYVPGDSARPGHTLLAFLAYDSAAWRGAGANAAGDSVASLGPFVYVLARPPRHPYAAGSADARRYEALAAAGRRVEVVVTPAPER